MLKTLQPSLRENQHTLIRKLANCIEDHWQHYLSLSPYTIPEDLGYVEGNLEGEKLLIENRCYQTPQFRKLHLELAKVSHRLDILHCVMFPHSNYNLPIFGVDLVVGKRVISAAIVDLSPVTTERILPISYRSVLTNLPKIKFSQHRDLPKWGDIFSEFCIFVRPADAQEEAAFFEQVKHFLTLHCQIATAMMPISYPYQEAEILAGQRYYCTQQQHNDKTRRILEQSFGQQWTQRYITTMLFDSP
ncbi:MAG: phycocyanobilin:ferredoxin oxidoreductase [Moorea sp. SIO2I5]|nr:phycocyanobilin:ferredoxin oxidoreductase [Moorena sp. SIO2I5]